MAKNKKYQNSYWDDFWDNSQDNNNVITKDVNWNELQTWDTVIAIKDLKWKWVNIKRWDKFKNIRLTDEEWIIESWKLVLKTEFFKKSK